MQPAQRPTDPETTVALKLGHAMGTHRRTQYILIVASVVVPLLLIATMRFYRLPCGWVMAFQIGLPWIAHRYVGRNSMLMFLLGAWISYLALHSYNYVSLLGFPQLLVIACVVGPIVSVIARVRDPDSRLKRDGVAQFLGGCFAIVYTYVALFQVNCLLDKSPATVYQVAVTRKVFEIHVPDQFRLAAWSNQNANSRVSVPYTLYKAVRVGDTICIVQRQGWLGIGWYTAQPCPWNGKDVALGRGY